MRGGREQALLKDPYIPTPCHDDLLNLNWLDEDVTGEIGEVRLLDWEYAGMGDIFFDLGNFTHHHRARRRPGAAAAAGILRRGDARRTLHGCKLMWPMSEIHEAMWGTTQTGISKLDEDFQGYADLLFGRAREHITDLRWEQWKKDVPRSRRLAQRRRLPRRGSTLHATTSGRTIAHARFVGEHARLTERRPATHDLSNYPGRRHQAPPGDNR